MGDKVPQTGWFTTEIDGLTVLGASQVALVVKNLPANETQETWVQFIGREEPPEKEMATHSSLLAWRIPWTEEPGGLQSIESQSQTQLKQLSTHTKYN